jgi:hypothetical protein
MKLDAGEFCENLSDHLNFHLYIKIRMTTSHGDLRGFLRVSQEQLDISNTNCNEKFTHFALSKFFSLA